MASTPAVPSLPELQRVHRELGLWMAHTKYELKPLDQIPIWRMQNTSIALSSGAGVGSFLLLKRLKPSLRFPLDIVPPFIIYFFTHRAAQVTQMPTLYSAFLALSSPLGEKTREILGAVRSNGRLPSHEFGQQLPGAPGGPPRARPPPPAAPPSDSFDPAPAGEVGPPPPQYGAETQYGTGADAHHQAGADHAAQPAPDVWADIGSGAAPEAPAEDPWSGGPPAPPSAGGGPGAPRRTWEEIRAEAASRPRAS